MNLQSLPAGSTRRFFLLVKIASHMKEWARCVLHHKSSVNCECSVHVYDLKSVRIWAPYWSVGQDKSLPFCHFFKVHSPNHLQQMLSVSYHVLLLSSGATLVKAHIKSYCEAPLQPISVLQSPNEFLDCFVPFINILSF